MKIPSNVAKGLRDIYGNVDRTVFAYSNGKGSIRYLALRRDQTAPDVLSSATDHKLVGHVDFDKMAIVGKDDKPSEQEHKIDYLAMAIRTIGVLLVACVGVILMVIALVSGMTSKTK